MSVARPITNGTDITGRSGSRGDPAENEDLLAGIRRVARERIGTIAAVALCVCAVAAAVAWFLPVHYTAAAEVIYDPHRTNGVDPTSNETETAADPVAVQNQIHILASRNLALRVINGLGLADDPELNSSAAPAVAIPSRAADTTLAAARIVDDRTIDAFLRHLNVQPLGLSTTFSVAFTSRNPLLASAVANALADAYIERQLDTKSRAARIEASWLTQRVRQLAEDTQRAEVAVQDYKRAHNISEVTNGYSESAVSTPLVDQELVALQTQLVQARATLAEKTALRTRLQSLVSEGSSADLSKIADSPEIVQLRLQESEVLQKVADLSARYGPKHPKVIAAVADQKDIESKIALEIGRLARGVENDMAVARAQVDSLDSSLHQTESQAADENVSRATLQSLEANAKSTRTAYETFVSRLRDVQGQEAMQLPDASIISRAPIPHLPDPPARSLIVAASVPIGLLLGLLVALLQGGVETRKPVTVAPAVAPAVMPTLRAPVLAQLPDIARAGWPLQRMAGVAITDPTSSFATSMRTLEDRLRLTPSGHGQVIGVTMPAGGDGSAVVAVNLARMAAQRGRKVVVLDAGASPGVGRLLNLRQNIPSIGDVLAGRARLSEAIIRDVVPNLYVMAGTRANDPVAPDSMARLLRHLAQSADLVIVNLPPASSPATAHISRAMNGTLLLLGWAGSGLPSVTGTNALIDAIGNRNTGLVVAR